MKPSVDVIVPCYNYGNVLEACVNSVLSQEGVDVRVLIYDDASKDRTAEVGLRLAGDTRVTYRRHVVNCGHIATYNEALAMVLADYCMILSADDLLTPGALARATRIMQADPLIGLVYGRDIPFRDAPPVQPLRIGPANRVMDYREFLGAACRLGQTGIQSPTAIVRTSLHRRIGNYLPELPHSGDTEIWLRMAAAARVAQLDADQAYRRLHAANMSLGYSPLQRLVEQARAFAIHFESQAPLPPDLIALHDVAKRTIAEAAVWSAAHAFERGDDSSCEAYLGFALSTSPAIESWDAYQRLRWKRCVGPSVWRLIAPLADRARRWSRPAPERRIH